MRQGAPHTGSGPTQAGSPRARLGSQLSECVFGLWNDKLHRKASDRKPEHKSVSTKHHTHRADRFSLLATTLISSDKTLPPSVGTFSYIVQLQLL